MTLFLIAGCGGGGESTDTSNKRLNDITLTATYFDFVNVQVLNDPVAPGTRLTFPFIPGNIFGSVSDENLIDVTIDANKQAVVSLNDGIFTPTTGPAIIDITAVNYGLSIAPADARFGRLGTFAKTSSDLYVDADGYGLFDGAANKSFMIVYFDRPARLYGSYTEGTATINVDISVSTAGFYAVAHSSQQSNGSTTTANLNELMTLSDNLYFIILPVGNLQTILGRPFSGGMNNQLCAAPVCAMK